MRRNDDPPKTAQRDSAHKRVLLGTAIGLCLAVQPVEAGRAPEIQDFTVRPELGGVLLTWTMPPVATCSRLVIRFRVDGPAPESPLAGTPLFDARTPPGAMYGTRHSILSPQHAYSYAAFALDAWGVVRASATAVATPLPVQLPGTVQNLRRVDVTAAAGSTPKDRK